MIIYQIYPRSFKDSNGDGLGDLRGITEKMPYIAGLGVDAVWISPFVKSPQKDFGYDVSDYCEVDSRFGTLDDFRKLTSAAHRNGLRVIMDQVWCHCSDQHAWFRESRQNRTNPKADWFVWVEPHLGGMPPNNWLSYFGGPAWTWDTARQQYYFHQFLSSQPTFNLRNPKVRKALLDVGRFWLEMGVDGFRLDALHTGFADPKFRNNPPRPRGVAVPPDVPPDIPQARQIRAHSEAHPDALVFLEQIRTLADQYDAVLLGELGGENPYALATLYTQGRRLHKAYTFGLLKRRPDAAYFQKMVVKSEREKNGGAFCYALSNHDVPRVASRWLVDRNKRDAERVARTALLFGLTLPGHYCMYQGEELGLTEADVPYDRLVDPFGLAFYPKFKGRDGCRTPFPWNAKARNGGFSTAKNTWLPFAEEHRKNAVDVQDKDKQSTLNFARALIDWHRSQPALQRDGFKALKGSGDVIAYERHGGGQRLLCLFNLGTKPATWVVAGGLASAPVKWAVAATHKGTKVNLQPMGSIVLQLATQSHKQKA
jgi:alpha-glucosidase